jgi:hypothetical protein
MAVNFRKAGIEDVPGISAVCSAGWRDTYQGLYSKAYIDWVIEEFYSLERIEREVRDPTPYDGWLVAEQNLSIVGGASGGVVSPSSWEIFVLYLDP